jgi:hypothetical protein
MAYERRARFDKRRVSTMTSELASCYSAMQVAQLFDGWHAGDSSDGLVTTLRSKGLEIQRSKGPRVKRSGRGL